MHHLLAAIALLVSLAPSSDDVRIAREAAVVLLSTGGEVVEGDFLVVLDDGKELPAVEAVFCR